MCYDYHMYSLKELLFDEIHDPFEDIQEWYVNYRDNLMQFLENAYIDKMHCGNGFRIIITYGDEDEEFKFVRFVGRFVPKNDDNRENFVPANEIGDSDDYRDDYKIANELKENDLSNETSDSEHNVPVNEIGDYSDEKYN